MLRILLQEIYEVEDCVRYDDASSDRTSEYTTANLNSLTFVTDHYEAYRSLGVSPTSTFYSPIYAEDNLPSNFEISVDVNTTSILQDMLTIGNNHPSTYTGATECGIVSTSIRYGLFKRLSGTGTFYTTSGRLSANTWYKFIVQVNGTSVTGKVLNNQGTELHSATETISDVQSWKKWNIIPADASHTLKWKNLKIKAL